MLKSWSCCQLPKEKERVNLRQRRPRLKPVRPFLRDRLRLKRNPHDRCDDCRRSWSVEIGLGPMLKPHIWRTIVPDPKMMLCEMCLLHRFRERTGHKYLRFEDLLPCPFNLCWFAQSAPRDWSREKYSEEYARWEMPCSRPPRRLDSSRCFVSMMDPGTEASR